MYRRPRFLEELHAIREEMSRQCDYDVDLFAEMVRRGAPPEHGPVRVIRGQRMVLPAKRWPNGDGQESEPDKA
ncbi:MAG: hypothetical protein AB1489_11245 [Acidobacteriota bacterium]